MKTLNKDGRAIRQNQVCTLAIFCDASATGYGGYIETLNSDNANCCRLSGEDKLDCEFKETVLLDCELIETVGLDCELDETVAVNFGHKIAGEVIKAVTGKWSRYEAVKSSTWRELKSVSNLLIETESLLSNHTIELHTDNKNVVSILKNGSRIDDLQILSTQVFDLCRINNVTLVPVGIPRNKNQIADFLSRCTDCDDWSLNKDLFQVLDSLWGPHTVDRFSSDDNAKCIRFNSRFWCRRSEAVDCFAQLWSGENNWWVPPPRLVCKTINKFFSEKANGTLVVPEWKSAPYWPLLHENGCFASFLQDHITFQGKNLTLAGRASVGLFNASNQKLRLIAFKVRF